MNTCVLDPAGDGVGAQVERAALEGLFRRRQASWVAETVDYFLKIPRCSGSAVADLLDPAAAQLARDEYIASNLLHDLDPRVVKPITCWKSCLVYCRLTGADVVAELRTSTPIEAQSLLEEGVRIIGGLHSRPPPTGREYDYSTDPFYPAYGATLAKISARPKVVVARGFEVRNLKHERPAGLVRFFDPHEVVLGIAEEDFARFVVSILMVNWNQRGQWRIWERFSLDGLLSAYESECSRPLDDELLAYAFRMNTAMRRYHAIQACGGFGWGVRYGATKYAAFYFGQIEEWGHNRGL